MARRRSARHWPPGGHGGPRLWRDGRCDGGSSRLCAGETSMTTFLRLLEEKDKAQGLLAGCTALRMNVRDPRLFQVAPASFQTVPGAPFAYWVSEGVRQVFREFLPLEGGGRAARQGGVNGDDFRWLRLWLEQENGFRDGDCIGIPIAKGGTFSKYYSDIYLLSRWS